jgi:hypothetical protein
MKKLAPKFSSFAHRQTERTRRFTSKMRNSLLTRVGSRVKLYHRLANSPTIHRITSTLIHRLIMTNPALAIKKGDLVTVAPSAYQDRPPLINAIVTKQHRYHRGRGMPLFTVYCHGRHWPNIHYTSMQKMELSEE